MKKEAFELYESNIIEFENNCSSMFKTNFLFIYSTVLSVIKYRDMMSLFFNIAGILRSQNKRVLIDVFLLQIYYYYNHYYLLSFLLDFILTLRY
jgi:hypothetical protein